MIKEWKQLFIIGMHWQINKFRNVILIKPKKVTIVSSDKNIGYTPSMVYREFKNYMRIKSMKTPIKMRSV